MVNGIGFNPWISILTKPRQTIRAIVDYNPNYRLLILSTIYGFSALLSIAQNLKLGERIDLFSILMPAVIIAPLWGFILFSLSSWFVFFTGKWIGGQATFKEVRAATAWANVPSIVNVFMWLILISIFQKTLFAEMSNNIVLSNGKILIVFSVMLVQLTASVWSLVIYINALAAVHKFSALKSILNIILSVIFISVILFLIFISIKGACFTFFDEPTLVKF